VHEGSAFSAITLTVGVAVYPNHGTDMAELVHAADEAMYRAKQAGRDRVQVAPTSNEQGPDDSLDVK
jgi:diguanylate cyclase (GGDEF)-like protein